MGLLNDLSTPVTRASSCGIQTIVKGLPEEEALAVLSAIDKIREDERAARAKQFSNQWLANVLTNNGYPVSRSTVARHVNGECGCE